MSFSQQVGSWVAEAEDDLEKLNKSIIFELFTSVILDTPVLEGRLRGNWIISSDSPSSSTVKVTSTTEGVESKNSNDPPRGPVTKTTVANITDFVNKMNGNKDFSVFLTNNLPYAYRIEFDGWSHTKAPEGMVRKNFIRISNNLKNA